MPEGKPLNIIEQEIQMNLCTSSDTHWKKKKKTRVVNMSRGKSTVGLSDEK